MSALPCKVWAALTEDAIGAQAKKCNCECLRWGYDIYGARIFSTEKQSVYVRRIRRDQGRFSVALCCTADSSAYQALSFTGSRRSSRLRLAFLKIPAIHKSTSLALAAVESASLRRLQAFKLSCPLLTVCCVSKQESGATPWQAPL